MHPASLGELGYYETRSNDCFSLSAYSHSKDRILSSKTGLESHIFLGWPSKAENKKRKFALTTSE